ncbi:uncharacterized protein PV06_08243 [Exophiala oligosperma]|uniref:Uncharacterized protein n=1 Tax=Exophiala oligosperma TaxID=215243 RepID=A0A0D2AHN6_9EURO|nr:uncharacterized protein PV06_08243 [Exophiala oligosperma]KIW39646.1 hypothetical protein PV06_08243 [Exophiala oligosperma]
MSTNNDQADASSSSIEVDRPTRQWGPRGPQEYRWGLYWYNRRDDNEPLVWAELTSYPRFDDPIPVHASLQEICERYPNHIRGSYLEAFIQWRWSANDIWKHITEHAKAEFRSHGVAKARTACNKNNFLFKRMAAQVRRMSMDKYRALMQAPKLRPAMKDGSEKYGKSTMQQRFLPDLGLQKWQSPTGTRQSPRLRDRYRTMETIDELAQSAFPAPDEAVDGGAATLDKLAEPDPELDIFTKFMGLRFMEQISYCETIIKADPFCSAYSKEQRRRWALSMLSIPVNAATETFFKHKAIWTCAAYLLWVEKKIDAVMERRAAATDSSALQQHNTNNHQSPAVVDIADNGASSDPRINQWVSERKHATSEIMEERQTVSEILKHHAHHVGNCHWVNPESHHYGLVFHVIDHVWNAVGEIPALSPGKGITHSRGNNTVEQHQHQQAIAPDWSVSEQLAAAMASKAAIFEVNAERGDLYNVDRAAPAGHQAATVQGRTASNYPPEVPAEPSLTRQATSHAPCVAQTGHFCGLWPSQLIEMAHAEHFRSEPVQDWTEITPDMWATDVDGTMTGSFVMMAPTETIQPRGMEFFDDFDGRSGQTIEITPILVDGVAILETDPEWLQVLVRDP